MITTGPTSELGSDQHTTISATFEKKGIKPFLEALGTPRALTVWLLYCHGEHQQLVDLTIDPRHYADAECFSLDYAATEFLSKADFLTLDVDRAQVAKRKAQASEEKCGQTNANLWAWSATGLYPDGVFAAISAVAWKIQRILGAFDPEEFVDSCGWGPGANVGIPRRKATGYYKYGMKPTCTPRCYSFCEKWFPAAWPTWARQLGWGDEGTVPVRLVPGNNLTTVPKNAKTDRTISVEPSLNLYLQKGVGVMMKRRLAIAGNDLRTQVPNQELARVGVERHLATVDFAAASDTISEVLVERLLPEDWYSVMNAIRCHIGTESGIPTHRWEKFSTMGNGFTFELETLIFLTLAWHCCDVLGLGYRDVRVFGDDVILPADAVPLYKQLASAFGFTINGEKTWCDGSFRESCGSHWFDGLDVKPIYLKSLPKDPRDLFKFANQIRKFASRRMTFGCDARFRGAWTKIHAQIPAEYRHLYGPESLGDSVIWENEEYAKPTTQVVNWSRVFIVPRLTFVPNVVEVKGHALILVRLSELQSRGQLSTALADYPTDELSGDLAWNGSSCYEAWRKNSQTLPATGEYQKRSGRKNPISLWVGPGPWLDATV